MSVMVTVSMSPRQAKLLSDICENYLLPGGPAWECIPEWTAEEGAATFTSQEVESLGRKLLSDLAA